MRPELASGAVQIYEFSGEEYEQVTREFFIPAIARTHPDFRGLMALQELGDAVLCRSHWGGSLRTLRTDQMAARATTDNVMLFCVLMAGECRHVQHDRFARQVVGMGLLAESRSPWERVASAETRSMTLRFPRELLPLRSVEISEACARGVDPAAPAMQILSAYLGRLFDLADGLTAPQRLDAGRAAIDLLAMALRDVAPSIPGGDGPEEVLLDMMQAHVREHLADPRLRVEELARRHHVSVRYAYTLFERIGTTPGAYLREQRLLAARAMLSDPKHAHLGTSGIAAAVGFRGLRTFERAFRRQYGMTPGNWRR
jgi:AraC-like DNA-binding protein